MERLDCFHVELKQVIGCLYPDGWKRFGWGDLFIDEDLEPGFQLRVTTGYTAGITDVAVKLRLTGKSKWRGDELLHRCRIVFPGDGEPDVKCSGWVSYRIC